MIDIGTSLAHKSFRRDLDGVLARARAAGVHAIVATGTSAEASRAVREIAQARPSGAPSLHSTAGVHPHEASRWSRDIEAELRKLAARPEVVAIGECGLDFDRNFSPRDAQIRCFEAQLERPRDGRNEPCFLPLVLAAVAAARAESLEQVEQATDATARAFFGVG